MSLVFQQKIDLIATDPSWVADYQYFAQPDDDFLWLQLGWDYQRYLRLRRDGHISSQLQKRRNAIVGRKLIVEPADDSRKAKKSAETAELILKRIGYESACLLLLEIGQLTGFAVLKVDTKLDEVSGLILPHFEYVPNSRWTFTPHCPNDRSPHIINDEDLDPATEIATYGSHELRLLTRRCPVVGERVPKDSFILYSFGGTTPWGLGLGYQCYSWFLVKEECRKQWLLLGDRLGNPPVLGEHPPSVDADTENNRRVRLAWQKFLKSISPNAWVDVSTGFKATLLEAQSSLSPDVHKALIDECNAEVSKAVLGEVPMSDRSHGSRAASSAQNDDRESSLTDADCNLLDEQLRPLWELLTRLNAKGCPAPVVRRETEADKRQAAADKLNKEENLKQAQRDAILMRAGLRPSQQYIDETYGEGWTFKDKVSAVEPIGPEILGDTAAEQLVNSLV